MKNNNPTVIATAQVIIAPEVQQQSASSGAVFGRLLLTLAFAILFLSLFGVVGVGIYYGAMALIGIASDLVTALFDVAIAISRFISQGGALAWFATAAVLAYSGYTLLARAIQGLAEYRRYQIELAQAKASKVILIGGAEELRRHLATLPPEQEVQIIQPTIKPKGAFIDRQ